jgi:hypothetical protein
MAASANGSLCTGRSAVCATNTGWPTDRTWCPPAAAAPGQPARCARASSIPRPPPSPASPCSSLPTARISQPLPAMSSGPAAIYLPRSPKPCSRSSGSCAVGGDNGVTPAKPAGSCAAAHASASSSQHRGSVIHLTGPRKRLGQKALYYSHNKESSC